MNSGLSHLDAVEDNGAFMILLVWTLAALSLLGVGSNSPAAATVDSVAVSRGEYVFNAAGCFGCHTDEKNKGQPLAGGRALQTPFGTFYAPNITPDPATGIGKWRAEDLARALREGRAPDGSHYYPALPYTAYTKMTDQDVADLWAYLSSRPSVARANTPHDLSFPYNLRFGLVVWKFFNFKPGALPVEPARDTQWQRGRYLVEALGHCAECHTERNFLGGLKTDRWMAGSPNGAEGDPTPNITPHPSVGMGQWDAADIAYMFKTGSMPEGDSLGASMAEVVEYGTSKLRDADLAAMAAYLKSLPAIASRPKGR